MEHITKEQSVQGYTSKSCTVTQYPSKEPSINLAIADLSGRYPEKGFAINTKSIEQAYCLSGSGILVTPTQSFNLAQGDTIIIPTNEPYYWEGNFSVLLSCSPAWTPDQHQHVDDAN